MLHHALTYLYIYIVVHIVHIRDIIQCFDIYIRNDIEAAIDITIIEARDIIWFM